jgi:Phosphate uptake regulator
MNVKKEYAINDLYTQFGSFSTLVLRQLDMLEKIITTGELSISDQTLNELRENEKQLDAFEIQITEDIIDTIVLQSPVASDLRQIMAMYQMVSNLERIGDLVIDIVDSIPRIKDEHIYVQMSDVINNMLISSIVMVKKSIDSFLQKDKEAAIWTIKNDDVIDEMNHKLIKKSIAKSNLGEDTQQKLYSFIYLNSIVSTIERIADHSTNVAEASIYSIEGQDIRHTRLNS